MNIRTLLPAVVLLTAGLVGLPAAAFAADAAGVVLSAQAGPDVLVHQGETVPVTLGLADIGDQAADGVVVRIRAVNDVNLPITFSNCRYFIDSNVEGAWCRFDAAITPRKVYQIDGFKVSIEPAATAGHVTPVVFQLFTLDWADKQGGIDALAAADAGPGLPVRTGTGGAAALVPSELTLTADRPTVGFAGLKLIVPSASPSIPATSGTATPSSSPAAPAGGVTPTASAAADGGGLPVTGTDTATIVGVGLGALALGGLGFVLVRRRRTHFVA